jgi:hypothetical protein
MGKVYISAWRKSMSLEDRRTFDQWLKRNAAVGAIFGAALVVMAILGSGRTTPPDGAIASTSPVIGIATVTSK